MNNMNNLYSSGFFNTPQKPKEADPRMMAPGITYNQPAGNDPFNQAQNDPFKTQSTNPVYSGGQYNPGTTNPNFVSGQYSTPMGSTPINNQQTIFNNPPNPSGMGNSPFLPNRPISTLTTSPGFTNPNPFPPTNQMGSQFSGNPQYSQNFGGTVQTATGQVQNSMTAQQVPGQITSMYGADKTGTLPLSQQFSATRTSPVNQQMFSNTAPVSDYSGIRNSGTAPFNTQNYNAQPNFMSSTQNNFTGQFGGTSQIGQGNFQPQSQFSNPMQNNTQFNTAAPVMSSSFPTMKTGTKEISYGPTKIRDDLTNSSLIDICGMPICKDVSGQELRIGDYKSNQAAEIINRPVVTFPTENTSFNNLSGQFGQNNSQPMNFGNTVMAAPSGMPGVMMAGMQNQLPMANTVMNFVPTVVDVQNSSANDPYLSELLNLGHLEARKPPKEFKRHIPNYSIADGSRGVFLDLNLREERPKVNIETIPFQNDLKKLEKVRNLTILFDAGKFTLKRYSLRMQL